MKTPDFSYYVSQFFNSYLSRQKNVSKNTIISYATTFKQFLIFCEDVKRIRAERLKLNLIDEELIADFLNWLEETRNVSLTTRNQRLVALHSFFRYVQKNFPIHMDLSAKILNIPYKKAPRTVVAYLCEDDMRTLLAQPSGNTQEGFRDMVLLSVLYDTGARVQELVDIRIKHIRLEKPAVVMLHGKGNKSRQVPIMPSTVNLLRSYLASYKKNSGLAYGETRCFSTAEESSSAAGAFHISLTNTSRKPRPAELFVLGSRLLPIHSDTPKQCICSMRALTCFTSGIFLDMLMFRRLRFMPEPIRR